MSPPRIFDTETQGDTLVVMLLGDVSSLIPERAKIELHEALEKLQPPEIRNVVVDFEQISHFGSLMLGSLHLIWRRISECGGRMALCNVSPTGREVLEVARFDTLWPICDSRREAIEEVRGDQGKKEAPDRASRKPLG